MFNFPLTILADMPPGRVFGLDAQTLISTGINLFNVALLAFVLAKLLYNPVRNYMAQRAERIAGQIKSAAEQAERAAAIKEEYETKLREIDILREDILREARALAAENSHDILEQARQEAAAIKQRAAADIILERERVKAEMKQVIIDVSAAMTEKVVAVSMDAGMHDQMFEQTVAELGRAEWVA